MPDIRCPCFHFAVKREDGKQRLLNCDAVRPFSGRTGRPFSNLAEGSENSCKARYLINLEGVGHAEFVRG